MNSKKIIIGVLLLIIIVALGFLLINTGEKEEVYNGDNDTEDTENEEKQLETYESDEFNISISYPTEWDFETYYEYGMIFFSAPNNNIFDFTDNLNIIVQDLSFYEIDLEEYTELSIIEITEDDDFKNLEVITSEASELDGNEAYKFIYSAELEGYDLIFKQTWTVIDDMAYLITYTAKEDTYQDNLDVVKEMISSFRVLN